MLLSPLPLALSCYSPIYDPAVSLALRSEPAADDKAILVFDFDSLGAVGAIDEAYHTISLTVPAGTSLASLTPRIRFKGLSVYPASGSAQDFYGTRYYEVTAIDGTKQSYAVTVTLSSG